ncbi:MAG TPA: Nramp family divalent metal transporter [Candidatus Limnocylindrales bacterium]|nr:Nramp family divalent metal transporter [Candidatus Limnocylindrales bacterium]
MASETYQIGVSRPPLPLTDLPTPEEVVGAPRISPKVLMSAIVGPSLIALGVSIGSGEWLLGPFNFAKYGFIGIGWIILVSAVLQVFYNVELARFTVATGEAPIVAFGRVPPGFLLWVPLGVALFYMAFIWGGWASGAGDSVFALVHGKVKDAKDAAQVTEARFYGVGLLALAFTITLFGRRISRTMELANWVMVVSILVSVIVMAVAVVPLDVWLRAFGSLVTPAAPPPGSTATDLGALAGFTALASGLNYFIIGHYRDKGYGMGHKVGGISGLVGGHQEAILTSGVTFPETERNAQVWRRWFRFILFDQWVIFFLGAIFGMILPSTLVGYLSQSSGVVPTTADMPTFAASQLLASHGQLFFYLALVAGTLILFSTQLVIFESLVRIVTDAGNATSGRFQRLTGGDPRRFYYPFMVVLFLVIAFLIFQALPLQLIQISANMSNLAALIIPFAVIYLNRQLPRPARITWWSYVVLLANTLFFGFFFLNFAVNFTTGSPLVKF